MKGKRYTTEEKIRILRQADGGKKNWLFVGSKDRGWKAAVFYTLIGNCRQLGIDPHAYIKDVLRRLPSITNRELPELLPAAWAARGAWKMAE